ncbi:MAG: hypothetical protein V4592_08380 [Bacteroidota bacterium]
MLHHVSWQQFLHWALILLAAWYVAVYFMFYHRRIRARLREGQDGFFRVKKDWEDELEDGPEAGSDLMGRPAAEEGVSSLSMQDFGFAPVLESSDAALRLGVVPDVLEELKTIFYTLERDGGGKPEFLSLLQLVALRYPALRGSHDLRAIAAYIREQVGFALTDEELDAVWEEAV